MLPAGEVVLNPHAGYPTATCPSVLLALHLTQIATLANQIPEQQLYPILLLDGKPESESSNRAGDTKLQFLKIWLEKA